MKIMGENLTCLWVKMGKLFLKFVGYALYELKSKSRRIPYVGSTGNSGLACFFFWISFFSSAAVKEDIHFLTALWY